MQKMLLRGSISLRLRSIPFAGCVPYDPMELVSVMTQAPGIAFMMATARALTMMTAALVAFPVVMVVMVALGIGIKHERTFSKRFCGFVCGALHSGVEPDPRVRKRHLRPHADAAADQGIRFYRLQETRKCAVSASVGINGLLIHDPAVFDVIELELLSVTEVLEDLSVFVCNCDSHAVCSFLDDCLIDPDRFVFKVPARDQQSFPVH